jgi:hypothetical protein
MKTLPLPCGHKALPPEIVRVFGDNITSVYCSRCKRDMEYVPIRPIKDRSIPLFPTHNESPYDYILTHTHGWVITSDTIDLWEHTNN